VAGVDGCRGGWVVATTGLSRRSSTSVHVVADLRGVVADVRAGKLAAVGIDMPIGLAEDGRRAADADARRLLGPRRSSLFPTPPRSVLAAVDYRDALARCRDASGVGMSIQAYHLLAKMREVTELLDPTLQPSVSEVHPETSFTMLRGQPCAHPKRRAEGRAERIDALRVVFAHIDDLASGAHRGAKPDDVLDALVAAWTARRMARGDAVTLGDLAARDARGMRLTIVV
jgi:predicted RNase H-like nuclease